MRAVRHGLMVAIWIAFTITGWLASNASDEGNWNMAYYHLGKLLIFTLLLCGLFIADATEKRD